MYVTICPSYQLTPKIRYRLNLSLARRKEMMNVSCPLTYRPTEYQLKKTIRHKLVPPPSVPSRSDASNNKKEQHRSSTSTKSTSSKSTSTSQQRRQQLVVVQVKVFFFDQLRRLLHPMRMYDSANKFVGYPIVPSFDIDIVERVIDVTKQLHCYRDQRW